MLQLAASTLYRLHVLLRSVTVGKFTHLLPGYVPLSFPGARCGTISALVLLFLF